MGYTMSGWATLADGAIALGAAGDWDCGAEVEGWDGGEAGAAMDRG